MPDDFSIQGPIGPLPERKIEETSTNQSAQQSDIEKGAAFTQQANQVVEAMTTIIMMLNDINQSVKSQDKSADERSTIQTDLRKIVLSDEVMQRALSPSPAASHLNNITDALNQIDATAKNAIIQLNSNQKLSQTDLQTMYQTLLSNFEGLKSLSNSFSDEDIKKLDPDQQKALKEVRDKTGDYATNSLKALSAANTFEPTVSGLAAVINPGKGVLDDKEKANLSVQAANNQLGSAQAIKSQASTPVITSGNLWNAIKNVICGTAFYEFLNRLSKDRTQLSMQNRGLSLLNKMLQQFGAAFGATGAGAWNFGGVVPNKANATQWNHFISELNNLHKAMASVHTKTVDRKVRSKYTLPGHMFTLMTVIKTIFGPNHTKLIFTTLYTVNYKFRTKTIKSLVRSGGQCNLMYDSLKHRISTLRQDARKVVTTPHGGKSTIVLKSLLSMASKLSQKLNKFKNAAEAMNNIEETPKGGVNVSYKDLKNILSNFQKYAQSFANSLKGDVSNMQNVSAEAGNNLKLELSIYQQYLSTSSSLIEILNTLAQSISKHLSGGGG